MVYGGGGKHGLYTVIYSVQKWVVNVLIKGGLTRFDCVVLMNKKNKTKMDKFI